MKKITDDEIRAAQLRFERHCASVLLEALAESGVETSEIDARLGEDEGFFRGFIMKMMDGHTGTGGEFVPLALAIGVKLHLQLSRIEAPKEPETDA